MLGRSQEITPNRTLYKLPLTAKQLKQQQPLVLPACTKTRNTETPRNTPEQSGTLRNTPEHSGTLRNTPEHSGTLRNTPEHSGTLRNTLENRNTPEHRDSRKTPEHRIWRCCFFFFFPLENI